MKRITCGEPAAAQSCREREGTRMKLWTRVASGLLVVCVVSMAASARAWNTSGHMQVAAVAWERLSPQVRVKALGLLKAHPRFKEDFLQRMPETVQQASEATRDKWIFVHAATWPDIAKKLPQPLQDQFDHRDWHFVNQPLFLDDAAFKALEATVPQIINLAYKLPPDAASAKLNAVQALKLSVSKINASATPTADKGLYLSWLMHLVGDVHQPLHSVALFSIKKFPKGDLGGNSIEIVGKGSLHFVWDAALGDGTSLATVSRRAKDYLAKPELRARGESAAETKLFAAWVEESKDDASADVYDSAILAAVDALEHSSKPADKDKTPRVALPQSYFDRARVVSAGRAVEAGYRLAELIEHQLKL
jgi:hypothetical protein